MPSNKLGNEKRDVQDRYCLHSRYSVWKWESYLSKIRHTEFSMSLSLSRYLSLSLLSSSLPSFPLSLPLLFPLSVLILLSLTFSLCQVSYSLRTSWRSKRTGMGLMHKAYLFTKSQEHVIHLLWILLFLHITYINSNKRCLMHVTVITINDVDLLAHTLLKFHVILQPLNWLLKY